MNSQAAQAVTAPPRSADRPSPAATPGRPAGRPSTAARPSTAGTPSTAARPSTAGTPSTAARPRTAARPSTAGTLGRPGTAVAPGRPGTPHGQLAADLAPRRPGRPRSSQADRAIIDATLEVFAESGPDGLGIEQVAARAGVGKATIYRRWPGKEDLLLDAIAALETPLPQPQGRSVRADLTALVEALCKEAADPRRARQFALLHGDGLKYPRLLARFHQTVMEPRRKLIRSVLRRGLATGELCETTDVDAATFLLSGAVLARGGPGTQISDARYARRIVEELMRGLAAR